MRKTTVAVSLVGLVIALPAVAQDPATPEEVIAKVHDAATFLAKEGKAGLTTFDQAESRFVWKDTYVFVLECAADKTVAHPEAGTRGITLSEVQDKAGTLFGPLLCAAAERASGGWVEYMWPKPVTDDADKSASVAYEAEPSRKVSYVLAVPEQPYQVGAGIYNETLTVEELDNLAK